MIAQLELIKKEIQTPVLRDYQIQFIKDVYDQVRIGFRRILGVSGTGSGKTVIASKIVADAVKRGRKVLFIVHLDVLVGQTYEKFAAFGIECGFIKAGWAENKSALVQIASAQTLPRRTWWKQEFIPDLIICDEAHETTWISVVSQLIEENDKAIVIGLTATPYRLSKKQGMADKYDVLVAAPTPGELMQRGFLCLPIYFGINPPDLSKVRTVAGDYSDTGLSEVMNDNQVLDSMYSNWKRLANDRKTIAFAVDVAHSKAIAQKFNDKGIKAEHLDGSTPIYIRQQMFRRLANGDTQVLSSCQALQIGFDCPPADCILMCRPTKSKSIYFQQLGRGLRPFPGKENCMVLDQTGNVKRFGFVEDIEVFELTEGKESQQEAPMKDCPDCNAILTNFTMECPHCGYLFPREEAEKPLGEMKQFKKKAKKAKPESTDDPLWNEKVEFIRNSLATVWRHKMKPGWVYYKFAERFSGEQPKKEMFLHGIFGDNPTQKDKDDYWKFLVLKSDNDIVYVRRYYLWEFGENRHGIT
ncbi:MAG: DEAD/DEAH box helicase family protein [Betaproteobacteria bacterium]|jgi:superfamily II DNA or RNA helicase